MLFLIKVFFSFICHVAVCENTSVISLYLKVVTHSRISRMQSLTYCKNYIDKNALSNFFALC